MEENDQPNLVWHYTDGTALKNIIENNELWASSAAFMNDMNELLSGNIELRKHFTEQQGDLESHIADVLEKHIPEEGSRTKDTFVLSGSTDPDSLTLWRNYGRHQVSFAVGLDKAVPLVPMIPEEPKDGVEVEAHPNPPDDYYDGMYDEMEDGTRALLFDPDGLLVEGGSWKPVIYDPEAQKETITKIFDGLRDSAEAQARGKSQLGLMFRSYAMHDPLHLIKNSGFLDEREERIVMWLAPDWKFVCHRAGPYGIMPYIKLTAIAADNHPDREIRYATRPGKLPIREIRVGPSPYSLAAVESLEQLLGFHGLHDVKVSYSEIPFR